ncbi:phosphoadenosine phosphosulfate reductase family protein [Nocardia noduli]|uniref:phosphoadenosine phosphosulfate reductase family protein n=1 Tax=Nocardia noduli TaxID=2815722 RepID=UPI001C23021C|nr:phosphoadenosine phosphosulfate reductase family protein [Nocardia noduli]
MTIASTTPAHGWEHQSLFELPGHDPVLPGLHRPTPADEVARLSAPDRIRRVIALREQADTILASALHTHLGGRRVAATCVLLSGGDDSTALTHMFRDRATHAIHCNTTIGVEQTRQFVRDTCLAWGLPLLEESPPKTYRQLVIERGFPGPAMHLKMYQRLKERGLRQARRKLVTDSRTQRIVFLAGRRRQESARRADIALHERRGSIIWVSPLANWTKLDLNTYRQIHADVPRNPVSAVLHMSAECLCGCFAKPGELEEIRYWFPETAAAIDDIAAAVAAAGHRPPYNRWGHRQGTQSRSGNLCSSCDSTLFDLPEPDQRAA